MSKKLTDEQREAVRRKEALLNRGSYAPIPHELYREILPELVSKYDGQTARDCLTLYMYLSVYVNGESSKQAYMWAYPTVKQIREHTGIHGDRIKGLVDILVAEGLVLTKMIPWNGSSKKMYMPLVPPIPTYGN